MDVETFIRRWSGSGGAERANYTLFLSDLCRVLGVDEPDPTRPDDADNAYVFEKAVADPHDNGKATTRRIDLYRRGSFVLEAKQGVEQEAQEETERRVQARKGRGKRGHGTRGTKGWDAFMQRARQQAESYVRLLPDGEGRPPFVLVVDVGHVIEIYSEFTRTGGVYRPFPDARTYRVRLEDLRDEAVRERLRAVWLEPLSLDPSTRAAEVTRQVADTLALLSRSMEGQQDEDGQPLGAERVSGFLMRMIFTMFAEDVGLIPDHKFRRALEGMKSRAEAFAPTVQELWNAMARGGYSVALGERIRHFNGGLFEDVEVLPVDEAQLVLLVEAAGRDWSRVEPSIFGTLVERALNPRERHKLGAHYTPRAYVERLVEQVIITPLQDDWKNVLVEVQSTLNGASDKTLDATTRRARGFVEAFLAQLRQTTVLDPACGTGNFLYVAMELMKRLEAEVVETLVALGGQAPLLGVDPGQFFGLEVNPRAARVAELVLWIGYLQLYARDHGRASPPEPILKAFHNIRQQDAVLAFEGVEAKLDDSGQVVKRWDGLTFKPHPVTKEPIPDEQAQKPEVVYRHPRAAEWPTATFICSNPPFLGAKRMREIFGNGYVEALHETWPHVPEATDFVLRWWDRAAQLVREGQARSFGLITTNSISQVYNRRVLDRHLGATKNPLTLAFAIPDHPWVDDEDGAAVRIAMTVGIAKPTSGQLLTVTRERKTAPEGESLVLKTSISGGTIHSNLKVGAATNEAVSLASNEELCAVGMKTIGGGFLIPADKAQEFSDRYGDNVRTYVRPYVNGNDLMHRSRGMYVIDFYGLSEAEVRNRFPSVYQHLRDHVYDLRMQNNNMKFREFWWILGHSRPIFRVFTAALSRYIVTLETAKHQVFQFLDVSVVPDSTLVTFGFADAFCLGILSSRIHVVWALALGGRLGVGNDPRYNKTRCFETFPFPEASTEQQAQIRGVAEEIDVFRKTRLAEHPKLTMTAMYNVLEHMRAGAELSTKDKAIHDMGLVTTLLSLHNQLDAAVADAYGWLPGLSQQEILERLVALNSVRVQEEKAGLIRYLRPEYQDPGGAQQHDLGIAPEVQQVVTDEPLAFPDRLAEQAQAVRQVLRNAGRPLRTNDIAAYFRSVRGDRVEELVEMLVELGQARQVGEQVVAFAA